LSTSKQAEIVDTSRVIINKGSKSFAAAAKFFDVETRENAYMLYAWCRHCDDVIDNQELGCNGRAQKPETTQQALIKLHEKTRAAIDDRPSDESVFEGLRYVLNHNQIPERYPLELLDGFAMDAEGHEYQTFDDTLQYCYYVAGVVGIMMTYIMGARDPQVLQRAADLGIAFQLTNISRDVLDDAEIGRVYLPGDWLAEAGIPADEISEPQHASALAGVVKKLLNEADRYYASAHEGLRALGFRSAWAVATASVVYRTIGELVRERGESAWQDRVIVDDTRKILGIAEGMLDATQATFIDRYKTAAPRDRDLWSAPSAH
jgi:15-cis-phytoene synthase